MGSLPANIYSVAAVREIERRAIADDGVPGYTLMRRAGEAAVRAAGVRFPAAKRWQVLAGGGNNGGDGFMVARLAARAGADVSVLALVGPDSLQGDAATAHGDFAAEGGVVMPWNGEIDANADLLFDAILGSGLQRDVEGSFAAAVAAINAHPAYVHALDVPTGINADSGAVMGCAVVADLTTTFVGLKTGLFLGEAGNYCGEIDFSDLAIGSAGQDAVPAVCRRINDALLADALAPRVRDAHKGDFGHVLVVGGGIGMPGAAQLCGAAALRAGAGRVSIATHPSHAAALAAARPELMCRGVADASELLPLLESADVIAFGPGLGRSDWAAEIFALLRGDSRPTVWDADALNFLAEQPDTASHRIITPHPGEAARLLATSTGAVQADRMAALSSLAETYGGTVVLKGAGSLISTDAGVPWLCTSGNPGMAAPGMGDVLTGVIAALLGQGSLQTLAATVGVEFHARAGDIAARDGERGMVASDVIDCLRAVVNP